MTSRAVGCWWSYMADPACSAALTNLCCKHHTITLRSKSSALCWSPCRCSLWLVRWRVVVLTTGLQRLSIADSVSCRNVPGKPLWSAPRCHADWRSERRSSRWPRLSATRWWTAAARACSCFCTSHIARSSARNLRRLPRCAHGTAAERRSYQRVNADEWQEARLA